MIYALVSSAASCAVDLYLTRAAAEADLREVERDDPSLARPALDRAAQLRHSPALRLELSEPIEMRQARSTERTRDTARSPTTNETRLNTKAEATDGQPVKTKPPTRPDAIVTAARTSSQGRLRS